MEEKTARAMEQATGKANEASMRFLASMREIEGSTREECRRIIGEAEEEARRIREEADAYRDSMHEKVRAAVALLAEFDGMYRKLAEGASGGPRQEMMEGEAA